MSVLLHIYLHSKCGSLVLNILHADSVNANSLAPRASCTTKFLKAYACNIIRNETLELKFHFAKFSKGLAGYLSFLAMLMILS